MQVKFKEESMKDNNLNTNQEVSKDEKKGGFFKKDSKSEKLHAENLELKKRFATYASRF